MKLVVGLGNPEERFDRTPHNVGFAAVDMIAKKYAVSFSKTKKNALYAEAIIGTEKVMLIKPLTYMNSSGDCVFDYMSMFKIDLKDLIVILDDIELAPGLVRVRLGGSGGTHNGLKNVIQRVGSYDFARIRIGVGEPMPEQDLADFVLSKIPKERRIPIAVGIEKACNTAIEIIQGKGEAKTL